MRHRNKKKNSVVLSLLLVKAFSSLGSVSKGEANLGSILSSGILAIGIIESSCQLYKSSQLNLTEGSGVLTQAEPLMSPRILQEPSEGRLTEDPPVTLLFK